MSSINHDGMAKISGFLRLPLEIRLEIYRNVRPKKRITYEFHPPPSQFPSQSHPGLAVLRVSKQIHNEAADVLYGERIFAINLNPPYLAIAWRHLALFAHNQTRIRRLMIVAHGLCFFEKIYAPDQRWQSILGGLSKLYIVLRTPDCFDDSPQRELPATFFCQWRKDLVESLRSLGSSITLEEDYRYTRARWQEDWKLVLQNWSAVLHPDVKVYLDNDDPENNDFVESCLRTRVENIRTSIGHALFNWASWESQDGLGDIGIQVAIEFALETEGTAEEIKALFPPATFHWDSMVDLPYLARCPSMVGCILLG